MSVNLQHLKAFVAVARLGSFVQAARLLHVSQPALTVQIRQLEETLGARLFDRNTRSVRPTQVGGELAPAAERILLEIESIVHSTRQLSAKQRGLVSIAALPSVSATILPGVVAEFKRRHPGVAVVLKDAIGQKVVSMVKTQEVDFGVGSFSHPDADVRFTMLFADRMSVVFPPGSPLARRGPKGLRDLAAHPLILTSKESSVRALVDRALREAGVYAVPAYEVTYMSTAAGLVRAGLGVAVLPTSAVEMGELAGLGSKPLRDASLTRDIGVIERQGRSLSPAAEAFVSTLRARVARRRRAGRP
jgi:LysR family transcriptional regulator, carnitine catabolism transcriptional activator